MGDEGCCRYLLLHSCPLSILKLFFAVHETNLCFSDSNLMNLQPDTGIKTARLTRRCGGEVSSMAVLIVQTFAINLNFSVFADLGRSKGIANYIARNVPSFVKRRQRLFIFFPDLSALFYCTE